MCNFFEWAFCVGERGAGGLGGWVGGGWVGGWVDGLKRGTDFSPQY
jgi:hypothetical protein